MGECSDATDAVEVNLTDGPQIITVPPNGRVNIEIRAPAGAQVILVGPSEEEEQEPAPAYRPRDVASAGCLLEGFGCLWKCAILPFQLAGMLVLLVFVLLLGYLCLAIVWGMLTGP